MKQAVRVILAGLGGYGHQYLGALLDQAEAFGVTLVAGVDPSPERCARLGELRTRGVPLFTSLEEALDRVPAELAVISTPIHFHSAQSCLAAERGLDVLCEKPLAATVAEARQMREAERKTGRFIAIGYDWSFSAAIQRLKADMRSGRFGRPLHFKTVVCWPRGEDYYGRNDWAGRLRTADGSWVCDSPVNNATSHQLHNMLYLLGPDREHSVQWTNITAELYRANPIETFDTAALRLQTSENVELLFLTSHAVAWYLGPLIHYRFEEADIVYDVRGGLPHDAFVARFRDGSVASYGSPNTPPLQKLREAAAAVRTRAPLACAVEAATPHLRCVSALHRAAAVRPFPAEIVEWRGEPGKRQPETRGLMEVFVQCYEQGCLPAELGGVTWAQAGTISAAE
jgi:predicted dehydrogenase